MSQRSKCGYIAKRRFVFQSGATTTGLQPTTKNEFHNFPFSTPHFPFSIFNFPFSIFHFPFSIPAKTKKQPFGLLFRFSRRLPTFPGGCPPSIIGTTELNFRVRYGNGCDLCVIITDSHSAVLYRFAAGHSSVLYRICGRAFGFLCIGFPPTPVKMPSALSKLNNILDDLTHFLPSSSSRSRMSQIKLSVY